MTSRRVAKGINTLPFAPAREFKETIQARARRDAAFRRALLREGVECMLEGDVETGKAVLRDFINATVGFEQLGLKTRIPPKSLIRMFGPRGNPQAKNLFDVVAWLQKEEGVRLSVETSRRRAR